MYLKLPPVFPMCELTLPETNIAMENGPFEYVIDCISYWKFASFQPAILVYQRVRLVERGRMGARGVRKSTSWEGINWFGSGEPAGGDLTSQVIRSWHILGDRLIPLAPLS